MKIKQSQILTMGIIGLLILSVLIQYMIYISNSKKINEVKDKIIQVEEASMIITNKITNMDLDCPEQKDCPDCNCPEQKDCPDCNCPEQKDCPKQKACPKQKDCPKCKKDMNDDGIFSNTSNYLFSTGTDTNVIKEECDIDNKPITESVIESMNNLNNYMVR